MPNPIYRYTSTPPPPGTKNPVKNTNSFSSARTHMSDRDFLRTNMANRFNNVGASTSGNPANKPPDLDYPLSPPHRRPRQGNPVSFPLPTQTYGNDPYGQFQRPLPMPSLPEGYVPLQQNLSSYIPQPPFPTSGSNVPLPSYFQQPPKSIPPPSYYSQYYPPQAPNMPTANMDPPHTHVPQ